MGEAVRKWAGVGSEHSSSFARPSGQRSGPESEAGTVPPWPGFPVGRLDCPSGLSFRFLCWPGSRALFATLSAGPSLCWEAGP